MKVRRALLIALAAVACAAPAAQAAQPLDPETYDTATHCTKHPTRGALALVSWLEGHVRGESLGIMRCERLSKHSMSLHAEGRAVDWGLNVHDPRDKRAADALVERLLKPNRAGELHVLARRMGIQELIWNCRYWGAGMEGTGRYSLCYDEDGKRNKKIDDTSAHRDHVHIGLSRAGARMRTSFWRGRR